MSFPPSGDPPSLEEFLHSKRTTHVERECKRQQEQGKAIMAALTSDKSLNALRTLLAQATQFHEKTVKLIATRTIIGFRVDVAKQTQSDGKNILCNVCGWELSRKWLLELQNQLRTSLRSDTLRVNQLNERFVIEVDIA